MEHNTHSSASPKDSPPACVSGVQVIDPAASGKDAPVTLPATTPPAPQDPVGAGRVYDGAGTSTSPTGAAHVEAQVSPPTSHNLSMKSRASLISVGPFCRICHDGEAAGSLLRPCKCSGTMASVHRHCLERWLNLTTSEACELCGHRFHLQYTARPFWEFLVRCDNSEARRALKVDVMCLLVLTPMAVLSVYLCSAGAVQYVNQMKFSFEMFTDDPRNIRKQEWRVEDAIEPERLEKGGRRWEGLVLVMVAVLLLVIYLCWAYLTIRYHVRIWRQWRVVHQDASLATATPPQGTPSTHSRDPACPAPRDGRPHHADDSSHASPS